MFVILDLSAFRAFLMSQGLDPYDAANWTAFLRFVGARYLRSPAIAYYSIVGEPSVPATVAATSRLVDFYRTVTDALYAADEQSAVLCHGIHRDRPLRSDQLRVLGTWLPVELLKLRG